MNKDAKNRKVKYCSYGYCLFNKCRACVKNKDCSKCEIYIRSKV